MAPSLRTERLLLRPFRAEDALGLAAHRSDPEIARYVQWTPPYPIATAEDLIARTQWGGLLKRGEGAMIAVELAAAPGTVIGDCGTQLLAEDERQATIGFTLARAHQGRGYATEAVRAVLDALFRGGVFSAEPLHRVTAVCGTDNPASQRVMERAGMRREAHFIENIFFKGAWGSEFNYAILRREWEGLRGA